MREATFELKDLWGVDAEIIRDYCVAILNAETEEDLDTVKSQMNDLLVEKEWTEEQIAQFNTTIERYTTAFTVEEIIDINTPTEEPQVTESVGTPEPTPVQTEATDKETLMGGLAISALVAVTALQQAYVRRKNKNKNM